MIKQSTQSAIAIPVNIYPHGKLTPREKNTVMRSKVNHNIFIYVINCVATLVQYIPWKRNSFKAKVL